MSANNPVRTDAAALNALQGAGGSGQGLELVREILFGADKRQTGEEFRELKTQLTQMAERQAKQMAAMEQSFNEKMATMSTQTQARLSALEATVTGNRESAGAALNQTRAAIQTQHDSFAKALADERRAADERQSAFVSHMRNALDVLSGVKKA